MRELRWEEDGHGRGMRAGLRELRGKEEEMWARERVSHS